MTVIHSIIAVFLGLIFFAVILRAIYQRRLRILYAQLWLVIGVAAIASPLLYAIFTKLHEYAAWPTPTSMIFMLAILLLLLLLLHVSVATSRAWDDRRLMARKIALLEYKIALLEHQNSTCNEDNHA